MNTNEVVGIRQKVWLTDGVFQQVKAVISANPGITWDQLIVVDGLNLSHKISMEEFDMSYVDAEFSKDTDGGYVVHL